MEAVDTIEEEEVDLVLEIAIEDVLDPGAHHVAEDLIRDRNLVQSTANHLVARNLDQGVPNPDLEAGVVIKILR